MYYYNYNFVSPEPTFAIIKEEFKSYMDTGSVDDLLFPTYLDKCLRKLGRSTYNIKETVIELDDFEGRLPDNFFAVREAWLCTTLHSFPYQTANSFYSQTDDPTTILISAITTDHSPECCDDHCRGECIPTLIQSVYKTNKQEVKSYKKQYLLKPGNISAKKHCDVSYTDTWNSYSRENTNSTYDSFDIRDNKIVTNFKKGSIYLLFYATDYDDSGNQMIPDNYRIKQYVEDFIKYKMFETLTNQCNDETFNQLEKKLMFYKQQSDESFIMADIEIKKQTLYQKQQRIKQHLNRFKMYELPDGQYRNGRRRN